MNDVCQEWLPGDETTPRLDFAPDHHAACAPAECGAFRCAGCRRVVPWCFGVDDDDPVKAALCDDCAVGYETAA